MRRYTKKERQLLLAVLLAAVLCQIGGASAAGFVSGVAQGVANSAPPAPAKLMFFGGINHQSYLGCLNCSEYATDSILNQYGPHGSRYAQESIVNQYSDFGSPYSHYSACNQYASDPPVIVDSDGNFYGRLTLNLYNAEIGTGRE
jgi:hypothetical protein